MKNEYSSKTFSIFLVNSVATHTLYLYFEIEMIIIRFILYIVMQNKLVVRNCYETIPYNLTDQIISRLRVYILHTFCKLLTVDVLYTYIKKCVFVVRLKTIDKL